MKLRSISEALCQIVLDLLYPRHCAVCARVIGGNIPIAICSNCIDKPLKPKIVRDSKYIFDEALAVVKYEEDTKSNMIKYKFKSIKYYHKAYAYLMDKAVETRPYYKDAIMCCVPLSAKRDRAYSQTKIIAEHLAEMWNSRFVPELLIRCRLVGQLSKMDVVGRRFNIKDSLDLNPYYNVYDKDVVVIDDVFTSGTTANECAKVLKMYGARNVYILCPCYD